MPDANETVEATLNRANRLFSSGMGNTLGILKEADADLSKRLHNLVKVKGTKDLRFTDAQALAYRQQIRLTQQYLDQRLLGHTHAQALKAVSAGTAATVKLLGTLEKRFTGLGRPLQLESQAMQDTIVRGLGSSLLRQNQASVARYSTAMVSDFERVMRVGALEGLTQHEVISKLVAQGNLGGINAAKLHAAEPGYFPKPSGYVTRRYWAERIVRTECLPGDQLVRAAVVRAVHRRWYEGPMIEVVTESGRQFSATPNHPMLTRRGWIGAGKLHKGDDLIGSSREQAPSASSDEHVAGRPPTISEVFDSVAAIGIRERRATAEPDFHGDGLEGEVDIFRTDRPLLVGNFAPLSEPLGKLLFTPSNEGRAPFCAHCGFLLPLPTAAQQCGFMGQTLSQAGLVQPMDDQVVTGAQALSDAVDAFTGLETLDNFGSINVSTPGGVWSNESGGAKAARCACCVDRTLYGGRAAGHALGDLERAQAREVQFDRVLRIEVRSFSGHVFNLTTAHGYYALDAAYTGNTAYAYNAANQATISTAKVVDFPDLQKKILAHFDNRTAPDSIYVHGQIRPVAGLFHDGAGREYLHPPARPNDRETVIPWRPVWHELPATAPAPPEEQAKAQVAAEPGLAPASSGQFLVQASRDKIVALTQKLKAQAAVAAESTDAAKQFAAAQASAAAAQLEGTQKLGAAKLIDAKVLARARAAQLAQQTKGGMDPEVLKAKVEAYKAEIQAKATQKIAELEAAKAARLKVAASKHLQLLGTEAKELFDNPGPEIVAHLKKTAKEKPELFAEMKKQLGVGGDSPHWVSVGMAKKLAPELDYSSFKKKSTKAAPPPVPVAPPPKLPPLEFKTVSGYIDIHDATTGQKLAYMKPGATPGSVSVTPPASLTGFEAKTFATPEEGAPYALKVSAALQLQKAEASAAAAKLAAMTAAEKEAANAARFGDQRKAFAALMNAAAKQPGARSFDLDSLVHARPPETNMVPKKYAPLGDGEELTREQVIEAGRLFANGLNSTQRGAIKSFTGSGYGAIRRDEQAGKQTVDVKALAEAFDTKRPKDDPTVGLQVWRGIAGVPKAKVEQWLQNGKLDHDGTASSSWGRSTAFGFAGIDQQDDGTFSGDGHGDTYKVVYRWANKSGRDVETISSHSGEREILQPKKGAFNVRAAYRPTGTRRMVFFELEEQ